MTAREKHKIKWQNIGVSLDLLDNKEVWWSD
jgi:hypothetical protein